VSEPKNGGNICTRTFIPHACHRSVGVLGAVTVATACLLPDSTANGIAVVPDGDEKMMVVEHPSGSFSARLMTSSDNNGNVRIDKAGVVRTARMLCRGEAYVRNE